VSLTLIVFMSKRGLKVKSKQEKYLISISKEFSEELITKLGKTKGVTWEYLLKRLLEKVEGLEKE
jgi:hypothetical protein